MKHQRGITLTGVVVIGFFLFLAVAVGVKVLPEYIEYYKILKDIKAVAQDPSLSGAAPADVRASFMKRAEVDHIKVIGAKDLDVGRNGNQTTISFSYTRVIPLVANVSLLLEFEGSSSGR